jgi:hypothetical protein
MIQLTHWRAQGSAQIRAATAQVQRRKWTLVGSLVVRDYCIGNLRRRFFKFASDVVSQRRRSALVAQALLTLASPSTQAV